MFKRVLLVLLAVGLIVALTPPALGYIYERQIRSEISAGVSNPAFTVEIVNYERGFYESQASVRLAASEEYAERFRSLVDTATSAGSSDPRSDAVIELLGKFFNGELSFDIDIQHGPLIIGDGIKFALATMVMQLDSSTGPLAELRAMTDAPYLLLTDGTVRFDGTMEFHTNVPPMIWQTDDGSDTRFSGFLANGTYDPDKRTLDTSGIIETVEARFETGTLSASGIGIGIDAQRLGDYIWLGIHSFGVESMTYEPSGQYGAESFTANGVSFEMDTRANDGGEKVSMAMVYEIDEFKSPPEIALNDVQIAMKFADIDVDLIEGYTRLQHQLFLATPELMGQLQPEIESLAIDALRTNPGFSVKPARFVLNGQHFEARVGLGFDGSALPPNLNLAMLSANPAFITGGLSARGNVETAEPLARRMAKSFMRGEIMRTLPPESEADYTEIEAVATQQSSMMIDSLIMQGLIERHFGSLSTDFSFDNGVLLVNGQPIPLGGT
ncbi:MAG: DUF945 family protein [Gammaproteobacteria bacterium]